MDAVRKPMRTSRRDRMKHEEARRHAEIEQTIIHDYESKQLAW